MTHAYNTKRNLFSTTKSERSHNFTFHSATLVTHFINAPARAIGAYGREHRISDHTPLESSETGRWTFGSLGHACECILKNLRELLHRCSKWIRRSEFKEASRATFVHVPQIFEMVRLHVPWVTAIPSITRRNAASIRTANQRHSIFNTSFTRSHRRSFC